jgi:cephalosporin hydroxylase
MDDIKEFEQNVKNRIENLSNAKDLKKQCFEWCLHAGKYDYVMNFSWMGLPIIQLPQDIVAIQEIIFKIKPDLIIETGIARGGSAVFYASMLELLGGVGEVVGVDIDIRSHNYERIVNHPMYKRISLIEGSSIDNRTIEKVKGIAKNKKCIMVCLDSHHTHKHVLSELNLYAPLVTKGSYCIVFDTIVEEVPKELQNPDRPWGIGNSPKSAVWDFLKHHDEFEVDKNIEHKILMTSNPDGYLRKIK